MSTHNYLDKTGLGQVWEKTKGLSANKLPIVSYGIETVLVDTTTIEFTKDGDNTWYVSADNPLSGFTSSSFDYNCIYKITWDGTTYNTYCRGTESNKNTNQTDFDVKYIGNIRPLGWAGVDNDLSFSFCITYNFYDTTTIKIFSFDTNSTHQIKISKIPIIKTIVDEALYKNNDYNVPFVRKGSGVGSVVIGTETRDASGINAIAIGPNAIASGRGSIAIGANLIASGKFSFVGGSYHRSVGISEASGNGAFAYGLSPKATGNYSFALGQAPVASGGVSFATGDRTVASAPRAFACGQETTASGNLSFAGGQGTIANHRYQIAMGCYNIADISSATVDEKGTYVEIIGNGTDGENRSNARTLDWSGNEVLAGKLTVGAAPTNNMDVATKQYVDSLSLALDGNIIQLKQGTTVQSSITLPIYNGGVSS